MKFKLENASEFGWEGLKGRAYNSSDDFAGLSGALFEVTGSHGRTKTPVSDRVYLILDGEGEFNIDGEIFMVKKTDMVVVPKDTFYDYKALNNTTLKMFLVHTPAFDPAKEERV